VLTIADTRSLRLPLDPYRGDPATHRAISQARALVFVRCMRRFGFELRRPQITGPVPSANGQRYGLLDEAQARVHGYHPPPAGDQEGRSTEPELSSPAAVAVADGTGRRVPGLPEDGCTGEARRRLEQGGPVLDDPVFDDPGLVDRLSLGLYARSERDGRVRRVFGAWSACMRRAGYDYLDPMKANDDPVFRTERPSPTEIATATADVRCKHQTNVAGVWATVETAYQQRAVGRYAEQLRAIKAVLDTQVRNATQVLEEA
jgi:hypothetical protein